MRAMAPLTLLNLLLPLLQPFAGALADGFGLGVSNAVMARASQTPVVPAGYAFSIWGPLFLLGIAYGIWQALPAQRDNPLLARLRAPLAAAFLLNNAWMVSSQLLGNGWNLVMILFSIVAFLLVALDRVARAPRLAGAERWLLSPLIAIWAGWATAASFANISITARWAEFGWFGLSPTGAAVVVILAAAAFGTAALWRVARGHFGYAFALVWALVAIIVGNLWERAANPTVAAVAGFGILLVAGTVVLARIRARQPAPGATAGAPYQLSPAE
jgi:hypothetical protein